MPDLPNNILTSFLWLCLINYWQAADMHLEIGVLYIQCAIKKQSKQIAIIIIIMLFGLSMISVTAELKI